MRDHAAAQFGGRARENGIAGAAGFEGAHLLQVLAFEVQVCAAGGIEQRILEHRCAQHAAGDTRLGRTDVLERYLLSGRSHGASIA